MTLSARQTEAAERGGAEERGTERGRPRRSAGGVRDLAGGLEARAGAARGQREENGGGRVWEADRINGEFEFRGGSRVISEMFEFSESRWPLEGASTAESI